MSAATGPGPRILFLTRKWPPAVGGMETWSAELVAELRRTHPVELHALPGRADGGAPGAAALVGFGLRTALRLLGCRGGHKVIQGGDMAIWPLVWLARLRSPARACLAAHGTDVAYGERPGLRPALYRRYMRLGARLLPDVRVVANSQATASRARAIGFRNVRVVPLATRRRLPPPPEPSPFLLFAGRLVRRKGLSWFVAEVLPRLPEPLRLKVAGTPWDDSERAALDHPRVEFLGPLPQAALAPLMAEALAVVIPNIPAGPGHFEGFGLIAVEAAAAGGVVLAPRLDGFTDSVIEGRTGLLLEPGIAAAWVAAIAQVVGWDENERRRFTAGAQDAVRRHFAWSQVAQGMAVAWETPAISAPSTW